MAQQTINVGTSPNDGTGTPLRTAFQYTNSNFSELYTAVGPSGNNIVVPGNATITGDLTVDTNTLKVDSANDRVGVGTASPAAGAKLGVLGATSVSASDYIGSSTWAARFIGSSNGAASGISFLTNSASGLPTPASLHALPVADYRSALVATYSADPSGAGYFAVNRFNPTASTTSEHYKIDNAGVATWSNVGGVAGTAMTLNANGLGIGVTPSAWQSSVKALQLGGAALSSFSTYVGFLTSNAYNDGAWKFVSAQGASRYEINANVHSWHVSANTPSIGGAITFTQAMTLDASGRLLVGTTSQPSGVSNSVATFKSTSADWSSVIWNSNAVPFGLRIQHDTDVNGSSNQFLFCYGASTVRAELRSNGGLANYQANNVNLSDIRTKTDIKPLASYWNKIKSLELVTFKYKDQTHSDDNIGLIAQQVESVAPELVDVDGFGETPADGVPIKTIYTTDLYHAAIKALQEAMTRIEALESKLA